MAENKYKGPTSAYGMGKYFNKMDFDGFMNSHSGGLNPIVQNQSPSQGMAPAPTPSTPQVNQLAMGSGSDPRGNAEALSNTAMTQSNLEVGSALSANPAGNNNSGLPDFTNQGFGPKTPGQYSPLDKAKRSYTGANSMYKASVQPSSGGSNPSYDPAAMGESFDGTSMSGFPSYDSGKRYENDATQRRYTGDKSYYQANVQPSSGPDPVYSGKESQSFDEVYEPKWGKEKVDLNRLASYDSGKRFSEEEIQGNFAEATRNKRDEWKKVVQDKYGAPDSNAAVGMSFDRGMVLQAKKGPDHSGQSGMVSMDSMKDELSSLWDQDIDPMSIGKDVAGSLAPNSMVDSVASAAPDKVLNLGDKLGKGMDAAKGAFSKVSKGLTKAAPAISALTTIGTGIAERTQRKKNIGNLRDSIDSLGGTIGNLANEEAATEDSMFDEYTEGNRRIGEMGNLALGDRLDAAKGSNLNTGSIKRIKEDLIKDAHRSTDVTLAGAADTYETKRDEYITQSRDDRAKMNEGLKKLKDQLKEEEKAQAMQPWSMAADLAIGAVSVANPMIGIGLSAVKNRAMG